ncbi:MAG: formate dehydrogenase accessory sulfurtransferase FdhD [Burkholderiaceae bacterium]
MGAVEPVDPAAEVGARDAIEMHAHERWTADAAPVAAPAELAQEVPIAFEYNGISHAVMLATPADLEDFALGFSVSEAIATPAQWRGVDVRESAAGVTLAIDIAPEAFAHLKARRRTLAGRTGCGICGTESLAQVLRPLPDLSAVALCVTAAALRRAHARLAAAQPLQRATGAAHVAVFCERDGAIVLAREDVGRHNALDKLIGALVRARIDARAGFALVTSRASVEMVQKSATAGIALLAAVSAPTALAVRTAAACGQTLIGFARGAAFNVYTRPDRLRAG